MKSFLLALSIIALSTAINVYANTTQKPGVSYTIENEHAQAIYETMTDVQEEGAAGHTFRKGKSIVCWRVNADMDDAQGKPLPAADPRRYSCKLHIDSTGFITAGNSY